MSESLRAEAINDFCNKICHNRTHAPQQKTSSYSITLLSRSSIEVESATPSALAVVREIDDQFKFGRLTRRKHQSRLGSDRP
jgi:hypothetical protein